MNSMYDQTDPFIASLVADLDPVAPLTRRGGVTGALVAALAAITITAVTLGLRADISTGELNPVFLLSSGLFLLLACAATYGAAQMSRPRVGNHQTGWLWASAMAAILPVSAVITWSASLLGGGHAAPDLVGWKCVGLGFALGLGVAAVLTVRLRRGAPTSPERAGLLSGIAAGSAGIFAVSLHCPYNDIVHIGLWHGLAVALSALAGRAIIPPLIRW